MFSRSQKWIPNILILRYLTLVPNTWKSGFRECCKLASKVIDRQKDDETNERLEIWCNAGLEHKYGKYAIDGARAGRTYGETNAGDVEALRKINDFDWLIENLKKHIQKKKYKK